VVFMITPNTRGGTEDEGRGGSAKKSPANSVQPRKATDWTHKVRKKKLTNDMEKSGGMAKRRVLRNQRLARKAPDRSEGGEFQGHYQGRPKHRRVRAKGIECLNPDKILPIHLRRYGIQECLSQVLEQVKGQARGTNGSREKPTEEKLENKDPGKGV